MQLLKQYGRATDVELSSIFGLGPRNGRVGSIFGQHQALRATPP